MNQKERAWLNHFVATYQQTELQIKQHGDYLDELLNEERRIRLELKKLELQKEAVLKNFAHVMLREEKKFSADLKE